LRIAAGSLAGLIGGRPLVAPEMGLEKLMVRA
jgi:hypothetical protein